jgi:Ni/Co efflux regulator RcnB
MHPHRIASTLSACLLALALAPVALAAPPADKGKGAQAAQDKGRPESSDKHEDKADADNRGQVVSDCNHRANEKKLQGHERQDYLEWCTDRGDRYQYDDRRYDQDRSCYRRADERGLSGDVRRVYVQECLRKQEKSR